MRKNKIKTTFLTVISVLALTVSCTSKGEPSEQGELLTIEQIKALKNDQLMNGKLVTIEGYAGICKNSRLVTKGKENRMSIFSDGICKGKELIKTQIYVTAGGIGFGGTEPRNFAKFPDDENLTDESIIFMSDDYQELKNEKLKFSGTIYYDGNTYSLENVTIHK